MSYSLYLTKVSLAGTKASVVRMLNAAYADLYDFGTYPGFLGSTIYELVDGEVKTTKIEPSLDTEGFYKDFSTLIDKYPGRYKAVLVEALENEIEQLQEVVRAYKSTAEIPESTDDKQGITEDDDAWINEILG